MEEVELPLINLSRSTLTNPDARRRETAKLLDAFSHFGFCLITGVSGYSPESLFKWHKWFFREVSEWDRVSQLATKAFNPANGNVYRGYFPLQKGLLSHKQGYDLGPKHRKKSPSDVKGDEQEEGNPFLEETPRLTFRGKKQDEAEEFYKVMYEQREILERTGDLMLALIAEAGGEDQDYFDKVLFGESPVRMHTFRPIRYPQRIREETPESALLPDGRVISTPAHQDTTVLTLLQTYGYPGLEIQLEDEWLSVPPTLPDVLVVNVGEQLAEMSNGRFKATTHRVLDIGGERFSLPFFYEPNLDSNMNAKIPRNLLLLTGGQKVGEEESESPYYPFGAFLLNKIPIFTEYKELCERLPAWMKEKYLTGWEKRRCWATKNGIRVDGANFESSIKK